MRFGFHASIREGYLGAAETALAHGASAFQYFPKNPRSLTVKAFDQRSAEACRRFCEEHGLISIAHTPYPTNLCTEEPELRAVTIASVLNDLAITDACGSVGVVVHFGQYKGRETDPLYGYQLMIKTLNEILEQWQGQSLILLENNAGQGNRMGTTLEELVQIHKLIKHPQKVGFCLDTCHAFASGIWNGNNWPDVMTKARELGYLEHLRAIHLNDSMYPTQSYRDRHAQIGRGEIGEKAFREMLFSLEIRDRDLPLVLETPATAAYGHPEEIRYLKELTEELVAQ
ncbi:deoxyribonuclease IV [Brevibacillus dissolubilis]|uniref:deoxyribonuclease IV n=1 Tax=Brevibacillus dissolubilis TaxID=1844116 RepID=UPI0011169E4B|nr:deoxyribonuclease IV [Brevibacillus dissolubilis]